MDDTDSVLGVGLTWDHEVESICDGVEERIRKLEALYARARWQQTQNPPQNALLNTVYDICNECRGVVESTKGVKRDSSHLVAKALELDMGVTKAVGDGKGFFDCNICLDTARDPVLTCCGHLFCWSCFYMLPCVPSNKSMLPYVYLTAKECPVCQGEVTDSSIIPIYGNGKGSHTLESDSCMKVPPRPRANRIENVRRHCLTNRMSQIRVVDALRRLRVGMSGTMGRRPPPPTSDTLLPRSGPRRHRSRLIARALSEVDDPPSSNTISGMFSGEESLPGSDDAVADEANHTSFGFLLDSPARDATQPAELTVNEPEPSSSLRRTNREPRRRRSRHLG